MYFLQLKCDVMHLIVPLEEIYQCAIDQREVMISQALAEALRRYTEYCGNNPGSWTCIRILRLIENAQHKYDQGMFKLEYGRGYEAIFLWGQAYNILMEAMELMNN